VNALDAAAAILQEAGGPMRVKAITSAILERGLWETTGKTPAATVESRLAMDIKGKGAHSRFVRTAPGTYGLNPGAAVGLREQPPVPTTTTTPATPIDGIGILSFTDAAAQVLGMEPARQPMHYRVITERALALGLIKTAGKTPEATLYAQIYQEIERRKKRGLTPRFSRLGQGMIGLTEWDPSGLPAEIEKHNRAVKSELLQAVIALQAAEFETLVGTLLGRMGFEDVVVTKVSGDGGIDARGVFAPIGESIRIKFAIQAKKWQPKNHVLAPAVQSLRGSLAAHERGLFVTTSSYSSGARTEAVRIDAYPIALIDGVELVNLLVEHGIGVDPHSYDVLARIPLIEEQAPEL
jgi:restriction system protein